MNDKIIKGLKQLEGAPRYAYWINPPKSELISRMGESNG